LRGELLKEIRDELNVKEIDMSESDSAAFGAQRIRLNFRVLGKKYGKAMKDLSAKVQALSAAPDIDGEGRLRVDGYVLEAGEYERSYEARPGVAVAHDRYTLVALDTTLSTDLCLEGWAREIVRRVQDLRKQAGYHVEDRIRLWCAAEQPAGAPADDLPPPEQVWTQFGEYICGETLAVELITERTDDVDRSSEVKLGGGRTVWVGVERS
jgi:isoleucyl-tRNA synthetase